LAVAATGAGIASAGYDDTQKDLTPAGETPEDIVRAYAGGARALQPTFSTKLGQALTTVPEWLGGSGAQGNVEAIANARRQELINALHTMANGSGTGQDRSGIQADIQAVLNVLDDPTALQEQLQDFMRIYDVNTIKPG
jgi:hypothetical protein